MESPLRQTEIDFTRGDQLGLLDELSLPGEKGLRWTAAKAVLRAIDSFGRVCFASVESIAQRAAVSRRVVFRALNYLESCSLIVRDGDKHRNQFGVTTVHWRIVWNEVEQCVRRARAYGAGCQAPLVASRSTPPNHQEAGVYGATVAHNTQEHQEPHTAITREAAVAEDWGDREKEQALAELTKHVDRPRQTLVTAIAAGVKPAELLSICDEFAANRKIFRGGGALVDRIRTGEWPAAGVRTLKAIEQAKKASPRESTFDRFAYRKYLESQGRQGEDLSTLIDQAEQKWAAKKMIPGKMKLDDNLE